MITLQTSTDWTVFTILLVLYCIACYYLLTIPMDVKKVGGLLFIKISKYQLSFCKLRNSKKGN